MRTLKVRILSCVALAGAMMAGRDTRADFNPIPINPASFNHDVVVEAAAPNSLSDYVTATQDGGTNKTGNTFYERGYNVAAPTTGIAPAGTTFSKLDPNTGFTHSFQMPPNYHTNNSVMVGHNNGGQTLLLNNGTLTLATPAKFSALSFLTDSGNGPVTVAYKIHYADASTEDGTFVALDWFNTTSNAFNCAGRVSVGGGGVQNVGGVPAGAIFGADVILGNSAVNVTSVDFSYSSSNGNTNGNGRANIFAISGAKDGDFNFTNTLAVSGFTYDVVVEADAAPTTGQGVAAGSTLTNNVTATMDGGTSKGNNCFYEKGYYAAFPNSGIPTAGSTITSAWYSAKYVLPPTYAGNCAVFVSSNVTTANVGFATPGAYSALSFLCATANGDTFVPCTVQFADGTSETNTIFVPDWFNRALPWAYLAHGRINPNNRTLNQTPDQFVDPFIIPYPYSFDMRGLGLPTVRLFDAVINVTNSSAMITNVAVTFTNGVGSTRTIAILAVSGATPGNVPPIFGAQGTPTTGQPNNAGINGPSVIKRWEGTNNIVLSVTNIAGDSLTYQWKKAPRGGGFRDKLYSFDYSTFANVANGGRISGANSSALVISNALSADSADYLVVASGPGGAATSVVATVMVLTTNISLLVGVPNGDILAPTAADSTPTAESIDHAIDRVAQKWLSDGLQWGGACCGGPTPFVGPVGFTVTPVSGGTIATAMRFYTANDTQGRDPMDYGLEGSNDGSTWTRITGGRLIGTQWLPTGRNGTGSTAVDALNQNVVEVDFANSTGYKSYRFTLTNTIDRLRQSLMQIAEIEMLGTLVPNPPIWVRQPSSATVFAGATPTFYATASGYPLPKYQWFKNGSTLIPGATGSAYTIPATILGDSGTTYSVTASNTFGVIPSTNAVVTVIAAPTQTYPSAVLADNPVGYWRLNEGPDDGSGDNGLLAHDYRGGHNGSYSNALINVEGYNLASDTDTAAGFGTVNTVNSYVANIFDVDFSHPANTAGGNFSIEAWVLGGGQTSDAGIVAKGYNGILAAGTGTGTEQFVLDVSGGAPRKFRFLVRDALGNGYVAQSTALPFDPITLNPVWHHLVGVCDQPNGQVLLYVDGLLAATGTIPAAAGIEAQPLPMTIGSRQSGGAAQYDNQWVGTIDDVAVYNSSLSASKVLAHFYGAQRGPIISLQPTNQTYPENVTATFNSAAYGPGTLHYQWYFSDGTSPTTAVGGQTAPNLVFTTLAAQNGNNYQLVVTNEYGGATGAVATLTVVAGPPSFLLDTPATDTVGVGHYIKLQIVAGGSAPFTYKWQKGGVDLSDDYRTIGSHSNVLIIAYATNTDSGNYQCIVHNAQGDTPSTMDAVTVVAATSTAAPFTAAATGWSLQGTTPPIMAANRLEVTSGLGGTARAAFLTDKLNVASFNASFVYTVTSGAGGADGAAFVIQNVAATSVGGGGGGLGYSGITPSVALGLNIYDPNTRGYRFLQNGAVTTPFLTAAPVLVGGNANPILVTVNYSGGVLSMTMKDTVTAATFSANTTVDIAGILGATTGFFGFTGADGGVSSTQVITDFNMLPPPVTLKSKQVGSTLVLSWPATAGAILRSTPSLTTPVWTQVTAQWGLNGTDAQVIIPALTGNQQFYRLDIYP